jgi:methionyl-tRNA formyltransferase
MSLRLVFMGTSAFAVPSLERLVATQHGVASVYTQPPRPAGRGMLERRTPVHEAALRLGLPVRTPASLRRPPEIQAEFAALAADLAVVAAYGLLLPQPILDAPRLGCINLHGSLLPRWRGAAPIQRAIMAGDTETGISIFAMEAGLDTGPVYARRPYAIPERATAGKVHDDLALLAADMLPQVIGAIAAGTLRAVPQDDEGVTYAPKIEKEEGRLDFDRPAPVLDRRIRALTPWPGCFCTLHGERLNVLEAEPVQGPTGRPGQIVLPPLTVACGEGALRITRVQRAGRRAMSAEELGRGLRLEPGLQLA